MTGTSELCSATIERLHRVLQAREKSTVSIGSSSYYKQHTPIQPATGTKAKGYDTHPFAGISHTDRTRNIFHNCHNLNLRAKVGCINVENTSILWKTVEKNAHCGKLWKTADAIIQRKVRKINIVANVSIVERKARKNITSL